MQKKNLILLLDVHQPYIRHIDGEESKHPEEVTHIFEAMSGTYIPLLNMFSSLEKDSVPFHLAMVFSPTLCSMLDDSVIQQQYIEWLDKRIELGKAELERVKESGKLYEEAKRCFEQVQKDKIDFTEVYGQRLLQAFASYVKKGNIEILSTAGTYAFLPHYIDLPEVINAQIETGLYACRHFFGMNPDGFWLPYMGYMPGVEKILRSYGFSFSVLATHGVLFSDIIPTNGIFTPSRCENSLAVFGCDPETEEELCGENGISRRSVYRDQNRDIGFELTPDQLNSFLVKGSVRIPTGYRYWRNTNMENVDQRKTDIHADADDIYDREAALHQTELDADSFLKAKSEKLEKALSLIDRPDASLVCVFEGSMLGESWYEGVDWLEQVLRKSVSYDISFPVFGDLLQDQFSLQKIHPYPSAASGDGYGEDMLDSLNCWMMRYVQKASERMIDLAGRFPNDTGLKARLLNMGAKELLLAQSGEWLKMIHDGRSPEYVARVFRESIQAFTIVFDSLGSNTVSTEWLTKLERRHTLFPWMNYRIFSKKK